MSAIGGKADENIEKADIRWAQIRCRSGSTSQLHFPDNLSSIGEFFRQRLHPAQRIEINLATLLTDIAQ